MTGARAGRPGSATTGLVFDLPARRVNLLLTGLAAGCLVTGVASWAVGTAWGRVLTASHAVCGIGLLVLAPAKVRGSVRTGMRRRRSTRWLSVVLGAMVVAAAVLGFLHATGLWFGVGYWSALWTHVVVAFALTPLLVWHVISRPTRPRATDLDRRTLVSGGAALAVAGVAYGAQEVMVRGAGLAGGDRRFSGSHEVASFDPGAMPSVSWINDRAPSTPLEDRPLTVWGRHLHLDELRESAQPVTATLDCTGGWFSTQSWDAVRLADLARPGSARSIRVVSATGYQRLFPAGDDASLWLAVGYGGQPLSRSHGAPVRLVAPGRRGPWWVKWVERVELTDRPWWFQSPFPLT